MNYVPYLTSKKGQYVEVVFHRGYLQGYLRLINNGSWCIEGNKSSFSFESDEVKRIFYDDAGGMDSIILFV